MGYVRKDVSDSSQTIITKVAEACEERTGLSRSTIRDVLKGMFYSHVVDEFSENEVFCVEALREEGIFNNTGLSERHSNNPERQSEEQVQWPVFYYNGAFHRIPRDFNLPKGGPIAAWQLWLCGDRRKKLMPLRRIAPKEMADRNMAKRFSDLSLLCRTIEKICSVRGDLSINEQRYDAEDANKLFFFAQNHLPCQNELSCNGNRRRPQQVTWKTMVKYIQLHKSAPEFSDIFPLS